MLKQVLQRDLKITYYIYYSSPRLSKRLQELLEKPEIFKRFLNISKDPKRFQENPKDSNRIQKIPKESKRFQKIPKDSKEGKYSCKALNCSSYMAKKANGPPRNLPEFKELDAPALLGRLKRTAFHEFNPTNFKSTFC